MQIGPRNEEEEALNQRFEQASAAFKEAMGDDVESLIVVRKGDGVFICGTGCVHATMEMADIALEKLSVLADEQDRWERGLN